MNAAAAPSRSPRRRMPLLVIADDCDEMRWIVRAALAASFDDVIEVANGRDLFWTVESLLSRHAFDDPGALVVADIVMPVYSGIDVIEAWEEAAWSIPLVAISSFPDAELRRRVRRIGGVLLPKPFTMQALQATADALMRRRRDGVGIEVGSPAARGDAR